ncbi:uncharacterized protein LOC124148359 isoform X2 [Haliotis rufescens]|uniref:uncharacterized protein LOC124148359 isoform X2 n=1 Tax=Haliotis rufescens TaxID=6454 RepID=UPI00201EFF24|nr:uncharacterized protein LOC124148359 isoform X2 [Haliotis rufescens]
MVSSRGVVREAWGQELLHIDVLYKPTVSCPREYVVIKGENINISCSIDSNPAPHLYIWTNSRGDSVQQGTQPTLTLTAVGPGTTGRYKCTAINKMESTTGAKESGIGFGDVLVTIGDQPQVLPGVTGTERSTETMSTNTPLQTRDDNTYLYILIAFGVVALVVTVVLVVVVIRMRKALKETKGDGINRSEMTEREGRVQYAAESDYTSLEPPAEAKY